jgi:4-amino-4-deoxy-L-arabinose transferase-like glycosyltransferase
VAVSPTRSRFGLILGVILLAAVAVRLAFLFGVARHDDRFYDAAYYESQAIVIAEGKGFVDPFEGFRSGKQTPAADHPPVTASVLAGVAWLSDRVGFSDDGRRIAMRLTTMLAGLGTVLLLGLLGRAVAGETSGLFAAGIGALYPFLWVNDGLIMSESFAALAVTAALLLAYRLNRRPSGWGGLGLGAVCGLAALIRAELILLTPLFAIPYVWITVIPDWRTRLRLVAGIAAGTALLLAPWSLYNLRRFDEPVVVSTNAGVAMLGSNCDAVYSGRAIGLTSLEPGVCLPNQRPRGDQSVISKIYRDRALDYMKDHVGRLPIVVLARVGRTWSLFRPADALAGGEGEGRPRWVTALGLLTYYPILLGAVGGAVILRRRRVPLWPLIVAPVIVVASTLVSYGHTRFRVPAEPSLVVLAAVALGSLLTRRRGRRAEDEVERVETSSTTSAP